MAKSKPTTDHKKSKKDDKKAKKDQKVPLSSKEILAAASKIGQKVISVSKKVADSKKADSSSSDSSESDSESDDNKAKKVVPAKSNGKAKQSDSDSDDSDSEDPKPKPAVAKVAPAARDDSSSSGDSSSEDEEKSKAAQVKAALTPKHKPTVMKAVDSKQKPAAAAAAAKDSSSSESDSDDSSNESLGNKDVEMADVSAPAQAKGKRKAEDSAVAPAKKAKVSNDAAVTENGAGDEATKTIFVGNVSWTVDNDRLEQEFAECGEIVSARIQLDRNTGRSRGFGYVTFATSEAVEAALALQGTKEIDGRTLNIDRSSDNSANKPAMRENRAQAFGDTRNDPTSVLFVGNLSWDTSEDTLWEIFKEHGDVNSVRLPTDRESGKPKGYGYVEFSSVDSAKSAIEALSGQEIDGRSIRLDFSAPRDGGGGRGRGGGGRGGDRGFGGGRGRGGGGFDRGGRGGGFRGGRGDGFRGGRGDGFRGGRGDGFRGGRGGDGFRGGRGDRGGRGGPRGGARTGAIAAAEGRKITF